jgi:hypothetical protein
MITQQPKLTPEGLLENDPANRFEAVTDYALQPFPEASVDAKGTLRDLLSQYPETRQFDATAYYSRRLPDLSERAKTSLASFNRAIYAAALGLGGLVVYYQGDVLEKPSRSNISPSLELNFVPDCLSFCIWQTLEQAKAAGEIRPHREAVSRVSDWYERVAIEKFSIFVGPPELPSPEDDDDEIAIVSNGIRSIL